MSDLLVRGVDDALVRVARAGASRLSAVAEHREDLTAALSGPCKRSFVEALASIPNVGRDEDFERRQSPENAPNVFD